MTCERDREALGYRTCGDRLVEQADCCPEGVRLSDEAMDMLVAPITAVR